MKYVRKQSFYRLQAVLLYYCLGPLGSVERLLVPVYPQFPTKTPIFDTFFETVPKQELINFAHLVNDIELTNCRPKTLFAAHMKNKTDARFTSLKCQK